MHRQIGIKQAGSNATKYTGRNLPKGDAKKGQSEYDTKNNFKKNQTQGLDYVKRIVGTIMSPEEIKAMAVCDLSDTTGDKKCLEDARMGPTEMEQECPTCTNAIGRCNGHFGMMTIPKNAWFAHPWYLKDEGIIINIMNLFCYTCFQEDLRNVLSRNINAERLPAVKFRFSREQIDSYNILYQNVNGVDRLKALSSIAIKQTCDRGHPVSHFKAGDNLEILELLTKGEKDEREVEIFIAKDYLEAITIFFTENNLYDFIGFSPIAFQNLIVTVIPVIPNCNRPVIIIYGQKKENDITELYWKMLQKIRQIKEASSNKLDLSKKESSIDVYVKELRSLFYNYIKNTGTTTKGQNKESLKILTSILDSKSGLYRNNLLSARVDNSGRTVIVGDNSIKTNEARIPLFMAEKFLLKLDVTENNLHVANRLIKNGVAKILIKNALGGKRRVIKLDDEERKTATANIGDRIYRRLMNGDIVIINRQPTLHRYSVMSMRARIIEYRGSQNVKEEFQQRKEDINTIGLNTVYVKGYNADFDGDEVHIHVPGSIDARAEALALMGVEMAPISDASSVNIFGLIQNTVWGAYEMTKTPRIFTKDEWQALAGQVPDFDEELIEDPGESVDKITVKHYTSKYERGVEVETFNVFDRVRYIELMAPKMFTKYGIKGLGLWNSYTLLSLAFPEDFTYKRRMDKEADIIIENGIFVSGVLTKGIIGSGPGSITQYMYEHWGPKAIVIFTSVTQHLVNAWMETVGFPVSIKSFAPSAELEEEIEEVKEKNIRRGKELGQKNVPGIFNQDEFVELLDELLGRYKNPEYSVQEMLGDQVFGELKSDLSFHLFDAMQVERNSFYRGKQDVVFRPEQVNKVLRIILGRFFEQRKIDSLEETIINQIYDPIINFLEDQMENPLDPDQITERTVYEKAELEADTFDHMDSIKGKAVEIVLSKAIVERGGPVISMIKSKARGEDFNLVQAQFGLGQQTKSGSRLKESISGGTRVLPFFLENDPDPEARGYVKQSLFRGLQPLGYFASSMPARETQTDTSLKTSSTGYMQKKLQACMGDFIIYADGTVRDEKGNIVSYLYGGHGFDPSRMIKKGDKFLFVDVDQLVREVNAKFDAPIQYRKEYFGKL